MKKILLLITAFFSIVSYANASINFTTQEKAFIKEHPIITVGGGPDWAPMDFVINGKYSGIAYDYLKLIEKKSGLKFHVQIDTFKNNLKKIRSAKIDMLDAVYYGKDRAKYMHFTRPYFEMLDYFFIRNDLKIKSIKELDGKTVAIPRGFKHGDILRKAYPKIHILTVNTFDEAIDAVLQKKADGLFDTYASIMFALRHNGIKTIIPFKAYRGKYIAKIHMASRMNMPLLATILDKSLQMLTANEKEKIQMHWFGVKPISTLSSKKHIHLNNKEKEWIKKHPVIHFVVDPDWAPFEFVDNKGKYEGIAKDYLDLITQMTGLEFQRTKTNSWQESNQFIKNRKSDMYSCVTVTPNRKKLLYFSKPYLVLHYVVVTTIQKPFIENLKNLEGKTLVAIKGYAITKRLQKEHPEIKLLLVDNIQEALKSVSHKKAYGFISLLSTASYNINKYNFNNLKIAGKLDQVSKLSIAIRNDWGDTGIDIINKALENISQPQKEQIKNRWIAIKLNKEIDYTMLWIVLSISALIILIILYWMQRLQAEIKRRKVIEEQLSMQQKQFSAMVSNIPGVVYRCLLDEYWTMLYISDEIERMTGYPTHDFINNKKRTFTDIMYPDDIEPVAKYIQQQIDNREKYSIEYRIITKNNEVKWVRGQGQAIKNNQEEVDWLDGVIFDITEIKNTQKQLEIQTQKAEEANRAKSTFLANMSHEIRTPMNAIIGFTDLLDEQVKEKRLKSYIKTIKSAGATLLSLINDILDLSKIEAGKLSIISRPTNVKRLIEDIASVFTMKVQEKGVDLIVKIDEKIPQSILIDDVRVRQILINLISNAIKFTEKGSIRIEAKALKVDGHLSKMDMQISVKDTGIGIPRKQIQKIFGDFEQVEGQDNRKYGGTGLGLAISKRLASMMGGALSVESQEGKGSNFIVKIYNIDVSNMQIEEELSLKQNMDREIIFEKSKILVVDDIENNRELIKSNFEDTNIEVISANDGIEAVESFRKYHPDLILMDIRMPNMDGYEAAQKIKEIQNVPIIALTASVMKDEYDKIKSTNFDGYLRKPVLKKDLILELSKFLPYKQKEQEQRTTIDEYKLSVKALEHQDEIQKLINQQIKPLQQKAIKSNNIATIKEFIKAVENVANEYELDVVQEYAIKLTEAIDSFDIIETEKLLHNFVEERYYLSKKETKK